MYPVMQLVKLAVPPFDLPAVNHAIYLQLVLLNEYGYEQGMEGGSNYGVGSALVLLLVTGRA